MVIIIMMMLFIYDLDDEEWSYLLDSQCVMATPKI